MSWWDPDYVEPAEDLRPYRVDRALSTLTAKQKFVIEWRYGLVNGTSYTLEHIASQLGISHVAVLKIQRRALEKLRDAAVWE